MNRHAGLHRYVVDASCRKNLQLNLYDHENSAPFGAF